jgi:hypothetical protein
MIPNEVIGFFSVYLIFLTSAVVRGEWSTSRPAALPPGERAPGTHWRGGWVDLRAILDDLEKRKFLILPGLELRPLGRPARSSSLYRLRCPGKVCRIDINCLYVVKGTAFQQGVLRHDQKPKR